jgi:lysophospholipase L1-like esterase
MRKVLKILASLTLGVLGGLVIMELLARLFLPVATRHIALLRMRAPDLQMDAGTNFDRLDYNPLIQRRPNSEWICDGRQAERMNNAGFRDDDFSVERKEGTLRMAVIGDSFTEGWMAPRGTAFPFVLRNQLGSNLEVMNFGLANRSPAKYLILYRDIVRRYKPDFVMVCLFRNDLQEDAAVKDYLEFDSAGVPVRFDFERYARHTPRMPQTKWEKRRDKWQWYLCKYSRVYPYAAVVLTIDPDFRRKHFKAAPTESLEQLWGDTEEYLRRLEELCRQDSCRLLVAYVPDLEDFQTPHPILDWSSQWAKTNGVPYFDAAPFLKSQSPGKLYIENDGHFNPEGHQAYGTSLAEWLKLHLKPDSSGRG